MGPDVIDVFVRVKFVVVCLALILSGSWTSWATAWGDAGHAVVCDVAYREMGEDTREKVLALLALDKHYSTFARACNWADWIKGDASFDWLKPHHYVNVPRGAGGVSVGRNCLGGACVVSAVRRYRGWLADGGRDGANRLIALKLLGHFVGDAHAPLHVGFVEDRGGNDVAVRFFGKRSNLHRVWDSGMLSRYMKSAGLGWRALGERLQGGITDLERGRWGRRDAGSGPGVIAWVNESYAIAVAPGTRYVGAITGGGSEERLGEGYYRENLPVVLRRLQQAGYRLARVLDDVLGSK